MKEGQKEYTKDEINEIEQTRKAADITIARLKKTKGSYIDQIDADTEEEGDKKFIEQTKNLWNEFAVHGMIGENKDGKQILKPFSDLDGKCSLELLRLSGIKFKDNQIEYVKPGEYVEGKINLDTGNKSGLVVEGDGETAFFDHHGKESKNDTSATKVTYETLIRLGLLEKKPYLDKAVEFVTQIDNKTFPEEEKYYGESYRTVLGLQRFIKPKDLINFFKDNKNPTEKLTEEDIKKMGLKERSREQKESIEKSIEQLTEIEKQGMIINSEDYGKIVIDIGKKIPGGFDAVKAVGCGAYIIWSPEKKSFFISSVKNLKHDFSQGEKKRETMWIKPRHDSENLKITLKEILLKLTNNKLQAEKQLKKYLETEQEIDLSSLGIKIETNKHINNKMIKQEAPKNPSETGENEIRNIEVPLFEEEERQTVDKITNEYSEQTKIGKAEKKFVSDLLNKEREELYREFAKQWLQNGENQRKMEEENMVMPKNASDEWKINMVLGSKEKGGMDAREDINDPKYKEIREKMDRIGILATDIKKDQTPPETPFLLLNHLKKRIETKTEEIDNLEKSNPEDPEIDSKKREIFELYSAMQNISEKTMGENLRDDAEKRVRESKDFISKERFIDVKKNDKEAELLSQKEEELIKKEFETFNSLSEKNKTNYQKKLGLEEPVKLEDFSEAILKRAQKNGIESRDFYVMLSQGYKPHEATIKRGWLIFNKKIIIQKTGHTPEKMSFDEMNAIVRDLQKKYYTENEQTAEKELEEKWSDNFREKIDEEIKHHIYELADSPGLAEDQVKKVYDRAKDRIMLDYIKSDSNKDKKTKTELGAIKKEFEEKGENINLAKFVGDIVNRRGHLENLSEDLDDSSKNGISSFLEDFGIEKTVAGNIVGAIKPEAYKKAMKTKGGFLNFVIKLLTPKKIS